MGSDCDKMADGKDPLVNGKPISSLRVVDLKKECDKRSLSKSGSKTQLIERLKTQLLIENLGSQPADEPVLTDQRPRQIDLAQDQTSHLPQKAQAAVEEDDCQNEFIKQYLAQQKQLIELNSSS